MDLVRLWITGGLAFASVLTLLSTAHPGNADPSASAVGLPPMIVSESTALSSPILIGAGGSAPVMRTPNDTAYGGLFLLPAAPTPPRPATFDERWRSGPTVWNAYIEEASRRFGVPVSWIRSVMQAESAGQQFLNGAPITSPKGAMGLMQVMPATYADLRARYGLGPDPYDPRDNVLAGTAYIREMYDRFGAPGFLAAYNAGPGRAGDWPSRGRSLPDETRRYLAEVAPRVDAAAPGMPHPNTAPVTESVHDLTASALRPTRPLAPIRAPILPTEAPLFVGSKERPPTQGVQPDTPAADGLFVVLSGNDRRRVRSADDKPEN